MSEQYKLISAEAAERLQQLLNVFHAHDKVLTQVAAKTLVRTYRSEHADLEAVLCVQERATVHKQVAELAHQVEALKQERQRMTAIGVADNDVLELNVGGTQFAVKRATLTQVCQAVRGCHNRTGRYTLSHSRRYTHSADIVSESCRPDVLIVLTDSCSEACTASYG